MKINDFIREVSEELGIPLKVCRRAYWDAWKYIRENIAKLPLHDDLTKEQFDELRPNFNLPEIGKLYVTWDTYQDKKQRLEYVKKLRQNGNYIQNKETETTVQPTGCDEGIVQ